MPIVSIWRVPEKSSLSTLSGRCAAICGRFPGAASKLPQGKRNAVLGRLWPKEECGCSARENHLKRGPRRNSAERFRWGEEETRSEGTFDLGRKRRMRSRFRRGPASRLSGHRHSRRLPSACLRGAAPHPSSAQSPHRSEYLTDQAFRTTLPCASSPNETRCRWAFVWF